MNINDKLPENLGVDQNGNPITLSQFKGKKFILYAYPKDNTSGCSAEACSLKEHYEELQQLGFEVIGISKDSQASHQKFIEKFSLPFNLISDTDTKLLQELGVWGEKKMYGKTSMGTLRTTFLVNENGEIEKIFSPKEIKTKIHAQQILDFLKK